MLHHLMLTYPYYCIIITPQKHRKTKRNATEISQSSGPTTLVADEAVHEERGDSVKRAATTATSLDAEQGSGVNTPRSDEERIELKKLMDMYTKLSDRVLDLENEKDAQALEIKKLKKRVKKLEKKKKSRTPQLKRRLFKVRIESSAEKSLEDVETQGRYGHDISTAEVTTASVPSDMDVSAASPIRPVDDSITDDITLAETLMKIKSSASRSQKDEGVMFKEPKLDEEARLEREREEEASNVALIEEWDSIEATIDADRQLAEQLQAQERDELTIVSNDDSAVNIESLATKYPIVDWKTHILTEDIIYYQIIKADGSTKNYKIFSAMLDDFDRQDVLDLNRLVKERFETTSPEGYDRLL
ncbi:hypothetical protein Tco_0608106 [Tanacetum coccineum]